MTGYVRYVLNGLNFDVPATELPPDTWTGVTNMVNRDGFMRRAQGNTSIQTASANYPLFWLPQTDSTGKLWYVGMGANQAYSFDGTARFPVSASFANFTPGAWLPGQITGGVINNIAVFNAPNQVPMATGQSDPGALNRFTTGGNGWVATDRVGVMRTFKNHIFAGNYAFVSGPVPDLLGWSSAATPTGGLPTEWVATSTNDARQISLGDSPGAIIDMVPLRDSLMVFKRDAMYSLNFIGGASVFSSRKVTDSFGMIGPNCAVDIGGQLVVLTPSDVVLTDGQSFKSIATQQVQRLIQSAIGASSGSRCWVAYNEATRNVILGLVPGTSAAQYAVVWNTSTQLWSAGFMVGSTAGSAGLPYATYLTLPGTQPTSQQIVGVEVLSGNTGGYVTGGTNNTFLDGSTISGAVRRYSLDLGEPDAVKTVTRVDLNIKCTDTAVVTLAISGQMDESQTVAFGPPITATKALNWQVPCFAVGRFISLEVACTEENFECHGFGLVTGVTSAY